MFFSNAVEGGARRFGLAAALAGALIAAASGAFAQSANDIIHSLAPTEHAPEAGPSATSAYRAPLRAFGKPPHEDRRYRGPRVEDTEVTLEGRHSRAYIDYSRAIDLTVYFDFNSSRVTERAR